MHQAFACDDRSCQMKIKFFLVKMSECLTAIAQSGKAIIATGKYLFFDAQFCNAPDQWLAYAELRRQMGGGEIPRLRAASPQRARRRSRPAWQKSNPGEL